MSATCGQLLSENILVYNNVVEALSSRSSCDVTNECAANPCSDNGVCVDFSNDYSCICDTPYFGKTCQDSPSYCDGHKCENGATCLSHLPAQNYTCQCPDGYKGVLCTQNIVNGDWSRWSSWSKCSALCEGGNRNRSRHCDSPTPSLDGLPCAGVEHEEELCNTFSCPVDGRVGTWGTWQCDVTCGNGTATRIRTCDSPKPQFGGRDCFEGLIEYQTCSGLTPCPVSPVDGGASPTWSSWSECSTSCGGGTRSRDRDCDNPAPMYGGQPCSLELVNQVESCNIQVCPVCARLRRAANHDRPLCNTDTATDTMECEVMCRQGFLPAVYNISCGQLTNFTWSHLTPDDETFELPECSKVEIPEKRSANLAMEMHNIPDSKLAEVQDELQKNVNNAFNCSNFCTANVRVAASGYRRRRSTSGRNQVDIKMEVISPLVISGIDPVNASVAQIEQEREVVDTFEANLETMLNNTDMYTVSVDGQSYTADMATATLDVGINCPQGSVLREDLCVNCAKGFYFKDQSCQICEIGFYQDETRQLECKPCPDGTTTIWYGARSLSACKRTSHHNDKGNEMPAWKGVLIGFGTAAGVGILVFGAIKIVKRLNKSKQSVGETPRQEKKKSFFHHRKAMPDYLTRDLPPAYSPMSPDTTPRPKSAFSMSAVNMQVE